MKSPHLQILNSIKGEVKQQNYEVSFHGFQWFNAESSYPATRENCFIPMLSFLITQININH